MAGRRCPPLLLAFLLLFLFVAASFGYATSAEVDHLLTFKTTISDPTGALESWSAGTSPCNKDKPRWVGIICNDDGTVYGLRLENMNLSGSLNLDSLVSLEGLRSLSLMNNSFKGPMPEVRKLDGLRALYLSMNQFSGVIPDDSFHGMIWLKKVYLSQNDFSGPIPTSLASLSKLLELRLDNNKFDGAIPNLQQLQLKLVNVANNNLQGPIPDSLSKMPPASFAGNNGLCGKPLEASCVAASPLSSNSNGAWNKVLMGAIAGIFLSVIVIGACLVFASPGHVRQENEQQQQQPSRIPSTKNAGKFDSCREEKLEEGVVATPDHSQRGKKSDQGKFTFLKEERQRFELQDLLKSSAEVLGTGNFGCTYKATLQNGPSMVVKRFKDMNRVGKQDYDEHMRRMGRLTHPSLLPLVAYYYKREEKLFVTDYIPNGSLADLLHGKGAKKAVLDWSARLKIVKGLARGLAYLYEELQMLSTPHGHLKSSNVLLNESFEPLMTDYALQPVVPQSQATHYMEAYKSPECKELGKTSKKSDMWSFGLLILEFLTGKSPATCGEKGAEVNDLASWVNSAITEGRAVEIFHKDMKTEKEEEGEVIKLMQIALACCEENVEKRWDVQEALDKIENLRGNREEPSPRDNDDLAIVTF